MHYIEVKWLHDDSEDPILLFSELDENGWEVRKVEFFRDGIAHFADANQHSGSTELGILPVPPLKQIAADAQFSPREITREEFEKAWRYALSQG
jgi:hypothetical protein